MDELYGLLILYRDRRNGSNPDVSINDYYVLMGFGQLSHFQRRREWKHWVSCIASTIEGPEIIIVSAKLRDTSKFRDLNQALGHD